MRKVLRYPFLTRGRPRRCAELKDIYVSHAVEVDIPEISLTETELAFQTNIVGNTEKTIDRRNYLRSHDGKLYRKLPARGLSIWGSFSGSANAPGVYLELEADLSRNHSAGKLNPVTAALHRQFDWELERESNVKSRVVSAWPNQSSCDERVIRRQADLFDELSPRITEIDEQVHWHALEMIGREKGRLLIIGGEMHIQCMPPAWVVDPVDDRSNITVTVGIATSFDGYDPNLGRRYFALDRLAEAQEYVDICMKRTSQEPRAYWRQDFIGAFETYMSDGLEMNQEARELDRLGFAFAVEAARRIRSKPDEADRLTGNLIAAVAEGLEAARATNHVLGTVGEISHLVHDLADAWEVLGMPTAYCVAGPCKARFGRLAAIRARELADGVGINLDVSPFRTAQNTAGRQL
jgi:hypothetical protein